MRWIKNILTETFRYKLSGIAMVTCMLLSMISVHYGILIYRNMAKESADTQSFRYEYTLSLYASLDKTQDIPRLPEDVDCNIKISSVFLYDGSENVTRIVDVIVKSSDENWTLVSGTYADDEMLKSGEPIALVGRNCMENAHKSGDDWYYSVMGEDYKVIGVLGADDSVVLDNEVVLYYDCLGSNAKKYMQITAEAGYTITLESNTTDVQEICEKYWADKYAMSVNYDSHSSEQYLSTSTPVYNEKEYCIIIYVFSFVCLAVVIKFWITQRTREMKICRAMGYSDGQMLMRIAKSMISMLIVSIILTVLCLAIIQFTMKEMIKEYNLYIAWDVLGMYMVIYILSIAAVSAVPIYRFLHRDVASIL